MTHFSDGLEVGGAVTNPVVGSTGGFGVHTKQLGYLDIDPLTKNATALAASQSLGAAGNLALTAGTSVTTTVDSLGNTRYVLDCARAVTITSAGIDTGITFDVSGYDIYGSAMTSTVTGSSASVATTTKAFASVTSIYASGATSSTVTAGTADVFGMPIAVLDKAYLDRVGWANTMAQDTGTFTTAVITTATTSTGDVRGTYVPSSASNGVNRLVVTIVLSAAQGGFGSAASTSILGVAQA